jgi:hypothetical protein
MRIAHDSDTYLSCLEPWGDVRDRVATTQGRRPSTSRSALVPLRDALFRIYGQTSDTSRGMPGSTRSWGGSAHARSPDGGRS